MQTDTRHALRSNIAVGFSIALMLSATPCFAQTPGTASSYQYAQEANVLVSQGRCLEASRVLSQAIEANRGGQSDVNTSAIAAATQAVGTCAASASSSDQQAQAAILYAKQAVSSAAQGQCTQASSLLFRAISASRAAGTKGGDLTSPAYKYINDADRAVSKCLSTTGTTAGTVVDPTVTTELMRLVQGARVVQTFAVSGKCDAAWQVWTTLSPQANAFMSNPATVNQESQTVGEQIGGAQRMLLQHCPRDVSTSMADLIKFAEQTMSLSKAGKCLQAEESMGRLATMMQAQNFMNNDRALTLAQQSTKALNLCTETNLRLFNQLIAQSVSLSNTKKCDAAEKVLSKALSVELKEVYRTESLDSAKRALSLCRTRGLTSDQQLSSADGEAIAAKNAQATLGWVQQGLCQEAGSSLSLARSAISKYQVTNASVLSLVERAAAAMQACVGVGQTSTSGDAEVIKSAQETLRWVQQGLCQEAKASLTKAQGEAAQYYTRSPDVLALLSNAAAATQNCQTAYRLTY